MLFNKEEWASLLSPFPLPGPVLPPLTCWLARVLWSGEILLPEQHNHHQHPTGKEIYIYISIFTTQDKHRSQQRGGTGTVWTDGGDKTTRWATWELNSWDHPEQCSLLCWIFLARLAPCWFVALEKQMAGNSRVKGLQPETNTKAGKEKPDYVFFPVSKQASLLVLP